MKNFIFCLLCLLCCGTANAQLVTSGANSYSIHAVAAYANIDADQDADGYVVWFTIRDEDYNVVDVKDVGVSFSTTIRTWSERVSGTCHRVVLPHDFRTDARSWQVMRIRAKTDHGMLETRVRIIGVHP